MVKSKNKIFSIALRLILCLVMVLGGIKIASGRNGVNAEGIPEGAAILSAVSTSDAGDDIVDNAWWYKVMQSVDSKYYSNIGVVTITNDSSKLPNPNSYCTPVDVGDNEDILYAYVSNILSPENKYDVVIYADVEQIYAPAEAVYLFGDGSGMTDGFCCTEVVFDVDDNGLCVFNTSNVVDMFGMFSGNSTLKKFDMSMLNVVNVEDFGSAFYSCSDLVDLNISGLDFAKVTNLRNTFGFCSMLKFLDLSGFDFSRIADTNYMLRDCGSLTKVLASPENFEQLKTIVDACDYDIRVVMDVGATTGIEGWKYNKSVPGVYDADTGYLLEEWPENDEGWDVSVSEFFSGGGGGTHVSLGYDCNIEHIFVVCGRCPDYMKNTSYCVFFLDSSGDCDIVGVCFADGVGDFVGVSVKVTSNTIFDCRGVNFDLINMEYDKWSDGGAILLPEEIERLLMEDGYTYVYTNDGISTKELTLPQNYSMQEIEDTTDLRGAVIGKNADEVLRVYNAYVKVDDPVEETGIDLYSGLAISGAMLVVACGCAVVMSKMKRKQSM
ncbi:MAG: BspA family leucine-rich repeat surface protein [Clostridiales bacterium]|nr:BspA family leucine-rich repeat surface protein [Candidatus Apopatousia equi]